MLDEWDHGIPACERAVALDSTNALYHLWLGRIDGEKADRSGFFSAPDWLKKSTPNSNAPSNSIPKTWPPAPISPSSISKPPPSSAAEKIKPLHRPRPLPADQSRVGALGHRPHRRKKQRQATAEREYRIAIDPSHGGARAWLNLAIFFRHAGRLDQMEQALTMASRPLDRPESLMDGAVLLRTGRNSQLAIQLLRKYLASATVEQGPAFKAHYLLGELLERQGDREGAAEQYNAALNLAHEYRKADQALKRLEP